MGSTLFLTPVVEPAGSLRGTNRPLERANKKIAKEAACPVRNSVAMRVFLVE